MASSPSQAKQDQCASGISPPVLDTATIFHPPPWRCLVCFDFDGTITKEDLFDKLAQFGGHDAWRAMELDWVKEEIGAAECMRGQVALINAEKQKIEELVDNAELDDGFSDLLAFLRRQGVDFIVVSDGIGWIIRRKLSQESAVQPTIEPKLVLGHIEIFANEMVQIEDNNWQFRRRGFVSDCKARAAHCKCQTIDRFCSGRHVIYVGDGLSDLCPSLNKAEIIFAKQGQALFSSLDQDPERPKGKWGLIPFEKLSDVTKQLKEWWPE